MVKVIDSMREPRYSQIKCRLEATPEVEIDSTGLRLEEWCEICMIKNCFFIQPGTEYYLFICKQYCNCSRKMTVYFSVWNKNPLNLN